MRWTCRTLRSSEVWSDELFEAGVEGVFLIIVKYHMSALSFKSRLKRLVEESFRCPSLILVVAFLIQLTAGTRWTDSGTATTTAALTWCKRKRYAQEEPISFSTRDATPFLRGQPVAPSEVGYQMISKKYLGKSAGSAIQWSALKGLQAKMPVLSFLHQPWTLFILPSTASFSLH